MSIAFFDLDRTILGVNSGTLWVKKELREGYITRWQAARALGWIVRYQLGFAQMEEALMTAIAYLRGHEEAHMRGRTHAFWHEEVVQHVRPLAVESLQRYRKKGDELVLLTSSSNFLSEMASAHLGLDAYLSTSFEVDGEGLFTGRPEGELCYGEGKLNHARAYASERGISLEDCTFYTDSASDAAVMRAVGQPIAVNPDFRLKREARAKGWPIVDWS